MSHPFKENGYVNNRSFVQTGAGVTELQLDTHAQFIYELALARLELRRFGATVEPNATLKAFRAERITDPAGLKARAAYITAIDDAPTDYARLREYNRTQSINQYLTHWFYPYKGKYHPQMVRALLNIMGVGPGDMVLDPFMGSGTTAVEAQLLGAHASGVDISPLCTLVSRVKTESTLILDRILAYRQEYELIARTFAKTRAQPPPLTLEVSDDERIRNFFKVAELIAHSDQTRRGRAFIQSFVRNIRRMSASVQDVTDASRTLGLALGSVDIRQGDARSLPFAAASVDAIVTSPPYGVALDYIENDAHALRALGYNPDSVRDHFIGVRGAKHERISLYLDDMQRCYAEMFRVLRPRCWCTIVIGNGGVGVERLDLIGLIIRACDEIGFEFVRAIDKPIPGRRNETGQEAIIMLIKPG